MRVAENCGASLLNQPREAFPGLSLPPSAAARAGSLCRPPCLASLLSDQSLSCLLGCWPCAQTLSHDADKVFSGPVLPNGSDFWSRSLGGRWETEPQWVSRPLQGEMWPGCPADLQRALTLSRSRPALAQVSCLRVTAGVPEISVQCRESGGQILVKVCSTAK